MKMGPTEDFTNFINAVIDETAGTTLWLTSSNAVDWSVLWSEPTPWDFSAVKVLVVASTFEITPDPGIAVFDYLDAQ